MVEYAIVDGLRHYISYCEFCGTPNAPASHLPKRCKVCAARYNTYHECKRAYAEDPSPDNRAALDTVIGEYKRLKERGYKVPADIP